VKSQRAYVEHVLECIRRIAEDSARPLPDVEEMLTLLGPTRPFEMKSPKKLTPEQLAPSSTFGQKNGRLRA
jgi:hypothetical protein